MLIGKVVGTLVSTHKEDKLRGLKFYVVQKLDMRGKPAGGYVVAVDAVGSRLLGHDPRKIEYLTLANGVLGDMDDIQVIEG